MLLSTPDTEAKKKSLLGRVLRYTTISAVCIFLLGVAGAYFFQTNLLYFPSSGSQRVDSPEHWGWGLELFASEGKSDANTYKWENVWLNTDDGVKLHAYWIKAEAIWQGNSKKANSPRMRQRQHHTNADTDIKLVPTFILFHGNSGNIGHRLPMVQMLQQVVDCNIFMLSYRGYGLSEGVPNESGLKLDAKAAVDWVAKKIKLLQESYSSSAVRLDPGIVAYGQSLGGAVAIYAAHEFPQHIHTLIIENTFLSIRKLVPAVAPILYPLTPLIHQKWTSELLIPDLRQRILVLVGESDELIPPAHSMALFHAAEASKQRELVLFNRGTHNDTWLQSGYFQAIRGFLENES
jgi:fermentation-respiration switch protein FrsA (DUF1100 family)